MDWPAFMGEEGRLGVSSFFCIVTAVPFLGVGTRFGKGTAMFSEREVGAAELHFNRLHIRLRARLVGSLGTFGLEILNQKAFGVSFPFFNYFL